MCLKCFVFDVEAPGQEWKTRSFALQTETHVNIFSKSRIDLRGSSGNLRPESACLSGGAVHQCRGMGSGLSGGLQDNGGRWEQEMESSSQAWLFSGWGR